MKEHRQVLKETALFLERLITAHMNILGIDPATKCGFAVRLSDGTIAESGTWTLKKATRLVVLRQNILAICRKHSIGIVAYELVNFRHKSKHAAEVYWSIVGNIQTAANEMKAEWREVTVQHAKGYATNNGSANKVKMMRAANRKWPHIKLVDDNHADALWIAETAAKQLGLIKGHEKSWI